MRLADLKVSEIILLAENLVTLLSGPELDSIDPAVRASLAAAIGTLPAEAREFDKKAKNLLKEAAAAFSERDEREAGDALRGRLDRRQHLIGDLLVIDRSFGIDCEDLPFLGHVDSFLSLKSLDWPAEPFRYTGRLDRVIRPLVTVQPVTEW